MPESTGRGITYPIATDLVRDPAQAAKLQADMQTLARTADDAIGAEGAAIRAEVSQGLPKPLPNGTNLDHVAGQSWRGDWGVGEDTNGTQIGSLVGLPEVVQGVLTVKSTNTGFTIQQFWPYNREHFWHRTATNLSADPAGTTWGPWRRFGGSTSVGAVRHDLLVEEMRRATTVPGLAGAVPVAVIFDHGTNNFRDIILPKLTARGIKATLALNSQMYDPASPRYQYDNQTSWSEINTWPVEIANHGRTHGAMSSTADLRREIVDGLAELRANLPGKRIFAWVQTGQSGTTTWQGFENGKDAASWAKSAAGPMIWENHAISTGAVTVGSPALYDMAGDPRQGVWGYWLDTAAGITTAKARIADAIAQRKGIVLRAHPELLGTAGSTTAAEMLAFLDWLADQQAGGAIKTTTFSEWSLSRIAPGQYDSGVRNVAQALLGDYTTATSNVTLSRTGNVVEFVCYVRQFSKAAAPTGTVLFTLPDGFRPRQVYRLDMHRPAGVELEVGTDGTVKIVSGSVALNTYCTFRFTHPTVQAPPTALPGT